MAIIPISTYQDLLNLSNNKNVNASDVYELRSDITCLDEYFPPIRKFPATFDGKNFKIIDYKSNKNGLFESTLTTATIKNLTITVNISSMSTTNNIYVGGLVGLNLGQIFNCNVGGEIVSKNIVGMLCGCNYNMIENSLSTGTVSSLISGGFVGLNNKTIQCCYSTVNLDISEKVPNNSGCILGSFVAYNQKTIKNSYATGEIRSLDKAIAGGFVGKNNGELSNSFCVGDVSSSSFEYNKGFCGLTQSASNPSNCYAYEVQSINAESIKSDHSLAGTGTVNNVLTLIQLKDVTYVGNIINNGLTTPAFLLSDLNMPQVYCKDTTTVVPNQTSQTIKSKIEIYDAAQLQRMKDDLTSDYILCNDIDCSGIADFEPIANYGGTFDGNGYAIRNFMSTRGSLFAGLPAQAVIKNVSVDVKLSLTYKYHNGGLVSGEHLGIITNCCVKGELKVTAGTTTEYVGGIVSANKGTIESSYTQMKIHVGGAAPARVDIGGICGGNDNTISRCYSDSQIICTSDSTNMLGGLVGMAMSTKEKNIIENCLATSSIVVQSNRQSNKQSTCHYICTGEVTNISTYAYENMVLSSNQNNNIAKDDLSTGNLATIANLNNTTWLANLFGNNFQYEAGKLPLLLHLENKTKLINNQQSEISTYVYLYNETSVNAIDGTANYKLIRDIHTHKIDPFMTDFNYCFNGDQYTLEFTSRLCNTLGVNGVIKNLYVNAGTSELLYTTFDGMGRFALVNNGKITNCSAKASIKITRNTSQTLDYPPSKITDDSETPPDGGVSPRGLICDENNGVITSCFADLNLFFGSKNSPITNDLHIGGIVGTNNSKVTACYTRGEMRVVVSASNRRTVNMSGICGLNAGDIESSLSIMKLKSSGSQVNANGICATNASGESSISNCICLSDFEQPSWTTSSLITNIIKNNLNCAAYQYTRITTRLEQKYVYELRSSFYRSGYRVIDNATLKDVNYMSNLLNKNGMYYIVHADQYPVLISTPGQEEHTIDVKNNMIVIPEDFNYIKSDCNYYLANDIDWRRRRVPIEQIYQYAGALDGNNRKILNYKSDKNGLFASTVSTAVIKNLRVQTPALNIRDLNQGNIGVLVGENGGRIENCCVKGGTIRSVPAYASKKVSIGALVGLNTGTITQCYSATPVMLSDMSFRMGSSDSLIFDIGGLVGGNQGTITRCFTSTDIQVKQCHKYRVGGLIGTNVSTVSDCYSEHSISCINKVNIKNCYVGGLIAYNSSSNGNVRRCYAARNIDIKLVGNKNTQASNSTLSVGLFMGYNNSPNVAYTYAGAKISSDSEHKNHITSKYSGFIAEIAPGTTPPRECYVSEEAEVDGVKVKNNITLITPATIVTRSNTKSGGWWNSILNSEGANHFETYDKKRPPLKP